MKRVLQIDREFMNLTVPLSDDEQVRFERHLMREGCLEPIVTWRGVILDGHKRYKFCSYEEIEYEVREMKFSSREDAVIWVCRKRLAGLTVHQPMFRYLVGKWFNCCKVLNDEKQRTFEFKEQMNEQDTTWFASSLATEAGIASCTVRRNGKYASAHDKILDKEPALFEAIIREDIRFINSEIFEMAEMDEKQLGNIRRKKLGRKDVKMRQRNTKEVSQQNTEKGDGQLDEEIQIITGIKEMPAFDPDMEINGLSLTIPTWINAIARTEKKMNADIATDKAKEQLTVNLIRLREQINRMLEVLT